MVKDTNLIKDSKVSLDDFEKKVLESIRKYNMLKDRSSVILGVSGGADSLCLLILLYRLSHLLNIRMMAVHVNHHIRGDEADADQKYVEDF